MSDFIDLPSGECSRVRYAARVTSLVTITATLDKTQVLARAFVQFSYDGRPPRVAVEPQTRWYTPQESLLLGEALRGCAARAQRVTADPGVLAAAVACETEQEEARRLREALLALVDRLGWQDTLLVE